MTGAICNADSSMRPLRSGFGRGRGPRRAHGAVFFAVSLCLLWSFGAAAKPFPESFADLAEELLPAVVNISTTQVIEQEERRGPEFFQFPPGSPFEEFFHEFEERMRPKRPRHGTSLGSGFIIDPEGYVVTNNHVIAEAKEITVVLQDGTRVKAEIIGRDSKTDLALLKIEAKTPLPHIEFGDSDIVRVGDWVVAIGNPFGLGGTVTAGIVSARARNINAGPYDDFIQTDASINRGNSGGPLFNLEGEVIGINTAIFSPTGGSVGIGFAIPSMLATPVLRQLRELGHTSRGWLGVRIQPVTDEIGESLGLEDPRGALIAKVNEGEPAERAGLKAGDIILRFDGKEVPDVRRLQRIVANTPVDRTVEVVVWRDEKEVTVAVHVGELEAYEELATAARGDEGGKGGKADQKKTIETVGLTLSTLTADLRTRYDLDEEAKGVMIVGVDEQGVAAEKGLRPGDLIVEVGQEEVSTPVEVAEKIDEGIASGRKSVLLLVQRRGDLRFVPLRLKG